MTIWRVTAKEGARDHGYCHNVLMARLATGANTAPRLPASRTHGFYTHERPLLHHRRWSNGHPLLGCGRNQLTSRWAAAHLSQALFATYSYHGLGRGKPCNAEIENAIRDLKLRVGFQVNHLGSPPRQPGWRCR